MPLGILSMHVGAQLGEAHGRLGTENALRGAPLLAGRKARVEHLGNGPEVVVAPA